MVFVMRNDIDYFRLLEKKIMKNIFILIIFSFFIGLLIFMLFYDFLFSIPAIILLIALIYLYVRNIFNEMEEFLNN